MNSQALYVGMEHLWHMPVNEITKSTSRSSVADILSVIKQFCSFEQAAIKATSNHVSQNFPVATGKVGNKT